MDTPHSFRRFVRTILKWFFRTLLCLVVLIFVVLIFFSVKTEIREDKTVFQAAPPTGHFVSGGDVQIFIQESGPAQALEHVVLIHGTGAWSEIWRETMETLALKGFHVVAIDVPPFGYSEKPQGVDAYSRERQAKRIIAVLDSLHIKKAILVGHSVGARPTIEVALEAPEKVSKLVLVDPALGFAQNSTGEAYFEQNDPSPLLQTLFTVTPLRNSLFASYVTNPMFTKSIFSSFVSRKESVTDARIAMFRKPLVSQGSNTGYADWFQYLIASQDNALGVDFKNFKTISIPTLIMWGEKDTVTPLWQGEKLHTLIPNSKLVVLSGVGHIPYIEDAKAFDNALITFLKP